MAWVCEEHLEEQLVPLGLRGRRLFQPGRERRLSLPGDRVVAPAAPTIGDVPPADQPFLLKLGERREELAEALLPEEPDRRRDALTQCINRRRTERQQKSQTLRFKLMHYAPHHLVAPPIRACYTPAALSDRQ